jgi:hypothetical protein
MTCYWTWEHVCSCSTRSCASLLPAHLMYMPTNWVMKGYATNLFIHYTFPLSKCCIRYLNTQMHIAEEVTATSPPTLLFRIGGWDHRFDLIGSSLMVAALQDMWLSEVCFAQYHEYVHFILYSALFLKLNAQAISLLSGLVYILWVYSTNYLSRLGPCWLGGLWTHALWIAAFLYYYKRN